MANDDVPNNEPVMPEVTRNDPVIKPLPDISKLALGLSLPIPTLPSPSTMNGEIVPLPVSYTANDGSFAVVLYIDNDAVNARDPICVSPIATLFVLSILNTLAPPSSLTTRIKSSSPDPNSATPYGVILIPP